MANPTIGHITCPITGEKECDVRRYSTGKKLLYYVSSAGMITPNMLVGQAWMKKRTTFIAENGEPLKPVTEKNEGNPVTESKPVKKGGFLDFLISDDGE